MQLICPKKECSTVDCLHKVKHVEMEHCEFSGTQCPACVPYISTLIPEPKYEVIEPVSIKTLNEAGMSKPMLWHFAFAAIEQGYTIFDSLHLNIDEILACTSQVHQCLDWLIDHGFIREKKAQLKVGSLVNVVDGSYSYGIKDNKLTEHIPIGRGIDNPMEVIEICEGLPTHIDGRETGPPRSNNLILRGKSGKIYFSHKRFVRLVQP